MTHEESEIQCSVVLNGSVTGMQLCHLFTCYCLWLLLHYSGTVEWLQQGLHGLESRKYFLSGPALEERFRPLLASASADPSPGSSGFLTVILMKPLKECSEDHFSDCCTTWRQRTLSFFCFLVIVSP